jgi:hypothetical protein
MDDQLAWAQKGMTNPLTRALAAKYGEDQLINEPVREEGRQFKREESSANRVVQVQMTLERLRQQAEDARLRAESARESVQQRAEAARLHAETLRQIAQGNQELRRLQIEAQAERDRNKPEPPAKPLPESIMKTLRGMDTMADAMKSVESSFKPEYGGVGGAVSRVSGSYNPLSGKASEEAANWWKDYENQAALVERHEKFGTALSAGEQAAWKSATIAPGMKADVIAHNLAIRRQQANKMYERGRDQYIKGGYPLVNESFPSQPGRGLPTRSLNGKTYINVNGQWMEEE